MPGMVQSTVCHLIPSLKLPSEISIIIHILYIMNLKPREANFTKVAKPESEWQRPDPHPNLSGLQDFSSFYGTTLFQFPVTYGALYSHIH